MTLYSTNLRGDLTIEGAIDTDCLHLAASEFNPGDAATVWLDSAGTLRLGDTPLVIGPISAPTARQVPVFSTSDPGSPFVASTVSVDVDGNLIVTSTTASTSAITGCAKFAGGVGIAKELRVAGYTKIDSRLEVSNVTAASSTTGSIRTPGGISAGGGMYAGGDVVLASATASTDSTTGALTLIGGLGVGGDANIAGRVTATTMTCSTIPSASTDVVRLFDLGDYVLSSALATVVDQDVRSSATPTWPVVTVTGAFPDFHTFSATGGVRGGLYRRTAYDTQVDSDEIHPTIVSLFTAPSTVPLVPGFKRWRHAIFGVNVGSHSPSIGALVIDSTTEGAMDNIYRDRAVELAVLGKWWGVYRPNLVAMPSLGVQHIDIADADRGSKAFLSIVPGNTTSVQYATITYYQDALSNAAAYIRFGNTRDSVSALTGGAVFDGGIGVAKNAYVGGGIRAASDSTIGSTSLASKPLALINRGSAIAQLQLANQSSDDSATLNLTIGVDAALASAGVYSDGGAATALYLGARDIATDPTQSNAVRVLRAPTGANDIVRLAELSDYVTHAEHDTTIASMVWQAPVISDWDFDTGNPSPLADGDRYVAYGSNPSFTFGNIYQWSASRSTWIETVSKTGFAVCYLPVGTSERTHPYIFDGGEWHPMEGLLYHDAIQGVGSVTHAMIDSYLDQAVTVASKPAFAGVTLGGATYKGVPLNISTANTYNQIRLTGGAGPFAFLMAREGGALHVCAGIADPIATLYLNQSTGGVNVGPIVAGGTLQIMDATASTNTSTGALRVIGGAGIGGALNVGDRITAPTITCATAPTEVTDVLRFGDFSALVNQDVRATANPSWPVTEVYYGDDYYSFTSAGGIRTCIHREVDMSAGIVDDITHPTIVSLYRSGAVTPNPGGIMRWRHAAFVTEGGNHNPSLFGLYIDVVSGNTLEGTPPSEFYGLNRRSVELIVTGEWHDPPRPALIAMPHFGVQNPKNISEVDRLTKAFLSFVPGNTTSVQYATITYYQNTASNGNAYIRFGNTRDATSTTSAGAVFDGGVSAAKSMYIGGLLRVIDTTPSVSQTTGAGVIYGGLGVGGSLYTGTIQCMHDSATTHAAAFSYTGAAEGDSVGIAVGKQPEDDACSLLSYVHGAAGTDDTYAGLSVQSRPGLRVTGTGRLLVQSTEPATTVDETSGCAVFGGGVRAAADSVIGSTTLSSSPLTLINSGGSTPQLLLANQSGSESLQLAVEVDAAADSVGVYSDGGAAAMLCLGASDAAMDPAQSNAVRVLRAPTDANDVVRLADIGDFVTHAEQEAAASTLAWQQPVIGDWDFAGGNPSPLADGNRYIAAADYPPFTFGYIYQWSAATSEWIETVPMDGFALCYLPDDATGEQMHPYVFNGGEWSPVEGMLSHDSIQGAGSLTHATIDSYLDQAVTTTSTPTFLAATLGDGVTATVPLTLHTPNLTSQISLSAGAGAICSVMARDSGAMHVCSAKTTPITTLYLNQLTGGDNIGPIVCGGTLRVVDSTASTSVGNGALRVDGGASIGEAMNVGSTITSGVITTKIASAGDAAQFLYPTALLSGSTAGIVIGKSAATDEGLRLAYKHQQPGTSSTYISLGIIGREGLRINGLQNAQFFGNVSSPGRVTAATMTCSTAPSAATDVARLDDLSGSMVGSAADLGSATFGPWSSSSYSVPRYLHRVGRMCTMLINSNPTTSQTVGIDSTLYLTTVLDAKYCPTSAVTYRIHDGMIYNGSLIDIIVTIPVYNGGYPSISRAGATPKFAVGSTLSFPYDLTVNWIV